MAYEGPNRLFEWYQASRAQVLALRRGFGNWMDQVREEPSLIWETPAVRYVVYGFGALISVWSVTFLIEFITPPPPSGARPQASTADFHVICEDATCNQHFVVHREFGFDDFPVQCTKCGKQTGEAARPCNSTTCQGRWVAPTSTDGKKTCPICQGVFP